MISAGRVGARVSQPVPRSWPVEVLQNGIRENSPRASLHPQPQVCDNSSHGLGIRRRLEVSLRQIGFIRTRTISRLLVLTKTFPTLVAWTGADFPINPIAAPLDTPCQQPCGVDRCIAGVNSRITTNRCHNTEWLYYVIYREKSVSLSDSNPQPPTSHPLTMVDGCHQG